MASRHRPAWLRRVRHWRHCEARSRAIATAIVSKVFLPLAAIAWLVTLRTDVLALPHWSEQASMPYPTTVITSKLESTYKLRTNIRPVRHSYFVSNRSASQLARAMAWCCTQWGGISNLIIPVSSGGRITPFYEHLLKMVEPDVLVSYMPQDSESGRRRHEHLAAYLAALWPNKQTSLHDERFEQFDYAAHPLSVISEADARAHEFVDCEFRGPREEHLVLLALFGRILEDQVTDYRRELRYGSLPAAADSSDFWQRQMREGYFASPINLTGYGFRPYRVEQPRLHFSAYFEVVLGDSLPSLCSFWNLRAIEESTRFPGDDVRTLLFMPRRVLNNPDMLHVFAEALHSAPALRAESNLDLIVYWAERTAFQAWENAIAKGSDFVRLREDVNVTLPVRRSPETHRGDHSRPLTYGSHQPHLPLSFFEGVPSEIPRAIPLRLGQNEIRIEPSATYSKRPGQQVMLDIDSEVWSRYPKYLDVAKVIDGNAEFSRYGVSFLSDVPMRPSEFHFNLPTEWETLVAVFQHCGLSVNESDKTHYLEAVVQLIGGLDNVPVLARVQAMLLLQSLAIRPADRIAKRLKRELRQTSLDEERIAEALRDSPIVAELSTSSKSYKQLADGALSQHKQALLPLLAELSKAGMVRRGHQLPCLMCDLTSWHPLRSLDEHVTCPGCGSSFPLPVELPPGSELQTHYVLNSLVNRAFDQGVIPALIAMSHVARANAPAYCKAAALEIRRAGDPALAGDLDFVMFANGRLLAGEAKSGSRLAAKDYATAEVAAHVGFDEYFFCTVNTFDDEALKGIEGLRERLSSGGAGMRVTVLDGSDLLSEDRP